MHISAVVTDPTDDVKSMVPERRKCLLEPEISNSLYEVLIKCESQSYSKPFYHRGSSFPSTQKLAANWRIASKIFWLNMGKKEIFSLTYSQRPISDVCHTFYQKYRTM